MVIYLGFRDQTQSLLPAKDVASLRYTPSPQDFFFNSKKVLLET